METEHYEGERPAPFKLERFFGKYEFNAPHLLCCSDCEPLTMRELLELADEGARQRWEGLRLSYTETTGLAPLREAIADLYGGAISPEQLLVCAPEEGVYLTMQALLKPGDRVVCAYPAYQSLYELALSRGCTLDFWEPSWDAAAGKLRFDPSRLEELVSGGGGAGGGDSAMSDGGGAAEVGEAVKRPRLVVVNWPHNPTGATLSRADQGRVVEACRAAGSYLFSDEMYWRSEPDESVRLPPAVTLYDKAITLCGLSKSWCLPGLRIGWVASQDAALLERVAALKDYTTICSSAPSEVLALIAVKATEHITKRARGIVAENTAEAAAFFGRWEHVFDWAPPDAGPIAFPRRAGSAGRAMRRRTAGVLTKARGIDDFCQRLVDEAGVLLLPASVYDHQPSTDRGHFRFGLGRLSNLDALRHFEAFLMRHFGGLVL
ncbi:aminotransferase, classes I and II [Monoraphidium neglectum]|uniref:Aminotransferase, classes I and II n=1 Tax=Monoraphidium neglectum TaxID=145388 RepID=A0A0D2LLX2_9CHLO|nr:aminotransferase, classes I and II [Monoraphidium neglectum]KIZ07359.1 aminotransferase, classes I and II [Monoraphidium neglectum]|eukprot:XP_013906378.1 aminotransferase, classes I and II [Monoraphidium neglectum]